jgi:hypothetical protein
MMKNNSKISFSLNYPLTQSVFVEYEFRLDLIKNQIFEIYSFNQQESFSLSFLKSFSIHHFIFFTNIKIKIHEKDEINI